MALPLFAFGIVNLPMLGWLAVAAAPILIHLWSRRKYREMSWAAMEYLLAAVQRQTRRLRLEQWLLLLVRTLLIVLLVLALAEPFLERSGLAPAGGGRTHRVLVIDGSYSMAYRPTDKSRFARAKELAERVVEESLQGDAFTLVLMAAPPRVVVGTPALEAAAVREEIENLELVHAGADLPATVTVVQQLIDKARRENPRLERHEVYFLTDLQRADWAPELGETALAEFRRQSAALAHAATLMIIDVGQPSAENLAVTALEALDTVAVVGHGLKFQATLKNFGRQARDRQMVELLVDGRRAEQQVVDIPAGGETSTVFAYRPDTPGDHTIEVRADGAALAVDNHRYLVVPVRQSIRVLCINGRPSGESFHGATDYLAAALAAQSGPGRQGSVAVDVAMESALLERDLGGYDCVYLCDVAQFTASEARVLDAYLGHGGSLVFALGGQVLADRYNRELAGGAGGPRILPARLGPIVDKVPPGLDPLDYRHKIVQAFRGREKSGLLTTPVDKLYRLEISKNSAAHVVLATRGGLPLLVEEPIRKGRVVLLATSADSSWTPMPLWPSYVPLMHEILTWCVGGQNQQRNVEVGDVLGGSAPATAADAPLWVQRPDGQRRKVPLHAEGDYSAWSYADTTLSGIYTARFGPPVSRNQCFAVNLDTRQSDLASLGEEDLRGEVWTDVPFLYQTTWQNLDAADASPMARPGRLHVGLLYGVLGLLFADTFLAWRFGHHHP